jgi:hypothetical protein
MPCPKRRRALLCEDDNTFIMPMLPTIPKIGKSIPTRRANCSDGRWKVVLVGAAAALLAPFPALPQLLLSPLPRTKGRTKERRTMTVWQWPLTRRDNDIHTEFQRLINEVQMSKDIVSNIGQETGFRLALKANDIIPFGANDKGQPVTQWV